MLALCLMLLSTYYAKNYASIIYINRPEPCIFNVIFNNKNNATVVDGSFSFTMHTKFTNTLMGGAER